MTNQRVSRQWPNKGKQSEEAILLLRDMVQELLVAFREVNNGSLPEHVIFYRDGVDDGQFERVLNEEVAALKQAFKGNERFVHWNLEYIIMIFLFFFSHLSSKI